MPDSSRRMLVLGHRGMLGHFVLRYFRQQGFVTSTVEARYDEHDSKAFWAKVQACKPDVVINCIGLIKQRSSSAKDLLSLNAAFPLRLRIHLSPQVLLVQPSTDCVFSGDQGQYEATALPDASDSYGISKALGEFVLRYPNTLVIRTSIIGPEISGPWGLLGWFLSNPDDSRIEGYTHHRWNGITTLEWCKLLASALTMPDREHDPLIQPGTERVYTKAELLRLFASTFQRRIQIVDSAAGPPVDRSLKPTWPCKSLELQLIELREWMTTCPKPSHHALLAPL